jgi:hypothetical protein
MRGKWDILAPALGHFLKTAEQHGAGHHWRLKAC